MKLCQSCKQPYKQYYKEHSRQCVDCMVELSAKGYIKKKYLQKNMQEIYQLMLDISKEKNYVMLDCLINDVKKFVKRTKEHVEAEYNKKVEGEKYVKQSS